MTPGLCSIETREVSEGPSPRPSRGPRERKGSCNVPAIRAGGPPVLSGSDQALLVSCLLFYRLACFSLS